jgi:hypothetical protein
MDGWRGVRDRFPSPVRVAAARPEKGPIAGRLSVFVSDSG